MPDPVVRGKMRIKLINHNSFSVQLTRICMALPHSLQVELKVEEWIPANNERRKRMWRTLCDERKWTIQTQQSQPKGKQIKEHLPEEDPWVWKKRYLAGKAGGRAPPHPHPNKSSIHS